MGQFSVGEDLFATLVVVSLLVLFVVALAYSYHLYAERRSTQENFELALSTAEELKNRVLSASPGSIEWSAEKFEDYSKLLAQRGVELQVEIRGLGGEMLYALGPKQNLLGRYFSPPCPVSLPVALVRSKSSAQLCELIVRVWGGRDVLPNM